MTQATAGREAAVPIDPQFLARWSPRAFDGTAVTQAELDTVFEAARWAPSAFNAQPWRFLYALPGTPEWDVFLDLLVPFNRSWAARAGALVFILSDTLIRRAPDAPETPSHSHSFDAGAAWGYLALQAHHIGLFTHGMTGVDFAAAPAALGVPERFRVECAVAIGRRGDPATLPEPLRARETPSPRRPVSELAFAGRFPQDEDA